MVNSGYQRDDRDIIDYRLWPLDGQMLRGPSVDLNGLHFSVIGAAQVFGRFVPNPFPSQVSSALGVPVLNLGMSGAGPTFFLRRPVMIRAINAGQFAVVQMMSGRSLSNSKVLIGANQGVGRLRSEPGADNRFAEAIYRQLLTDLRADELVSLRAEIRLRYIEETRRLLDSIKVPKLLLYWSQRSPEYQEGLNDLGRYWGDFPHFVDRETIDLIRSAADGYVEVITNRGIPQPLFHQSTGLPVLMWPEDKFPNIRMREHNHYYPSPEMNDDVAEAVVPAVKDMLQSKTKFTPLLSAHRVRDVVVHSHIFKNAGDSIDRSLELAFAGQWRMLNPKHGRPVVTESEVTEEIINFPELRAISARQLRFPLAGRLGVRLHKIVLLRNPLVRVRHIFEFERTEERRAASNMLHTIKANELDFAGWVEWCLSRPALAGPVSNFQTRICSRTRNGMDMKDWDYRVTMQQYTEASKELSQCLVGTVERLTHSLVRIEDSLRELFPEIQLSAFGEEIAGLGSAECVDSILSELGPQLFNRVCEANEFDLLLWQSTK